MSRSMTLRILVLFVTFLLSAAADDPVEDDPTPRQTCFDFTGRPLTNNTQCPGSNACCNYLHQCTDNMLCTQDDSTDYVNALCAVNPWSNCSNICQYGEDLHGYLPRVTGCSDGTFCCDTDPDCCKKGRGITLDGRGNIVSSTTSSELSTSTSTSSTSTGTPAPHTALVNTGGAITTRLAQSSAHPTATSSSASPSNTLSSNSSSELSSGVKAGIGVAVSFSALSFIVLLALFIIKRRQKKQASPKNIEEQALETAPYELHDHPLPYELPAELPEKKDLDTR